MSKLLSVNFARLKQNKAFWISMVITFLFGGYAPFANYMQMQDMNFEYTLEMGFFNYSVLAFILLSIFVSLFLGTEYSDGTIRNKIVVGHTRIHIYLSSFIVSMAAGVLMCVAFIIPYLCVGIPLFGFFKMSLLEVIAYMGAILFLIAALNGIYVLIAMLSQNKAVSAVACIMTSFLLIIAGSYITNRLNEPETYSSYVYLDTETGEMSTGDETPNPSHLEGTEREVYEFLYDFLPGGQVIQLSSIEQCNVFLLAGYSALIAVFTTGFGIYFFRRKDLK